MRSFLSSLFLTFFLSLSGQVILDSSSCSHYIKTFELSADGRLIGSGGDQILDIADKHKMILLGEYHGGRRIPELTNALLSILSDYNYSNHIAEIGPVAASVLRNGIEAQDPQKLLTHLNDLHWDELDEDYPIPFFNGPEDALMLQTIKEKEIELFGIDQEYYSSFLMLASEMGNASCTTDKEPIDRVLKMIRNAYAKDLRSNRFDICGHILKNDTLRDLEESLKTFTCDTALSIMNSMKASLDIYSRNYRRGGYSHQKRISLIRANFKRIWNEIPAEEKILVRIGGLHTARGTRLSAYDLGNLTLEPEYASVSFGTTNRYYLEKGEIKDNWAERSYPDINFSFRQMGLKDKWVIVDLQRILNDWKNKRIVLPEDHSYHLLRQTIEGYEYLLIIPLDEDQKVLLSKNEKN